MFFCIPLLQIWICILSMHSFDVLVTTYEFVLSYNLYIMISISYMQILKHEWPVRWRSFIPDLVSAAKTSETICENCMAILKVSLSLFLLKFVPLINE